MGISFIIVVFPTSINSEIWLCLSRSTFNKSELTVGCSDCSHSLDSDTCHSFKSIYLKTAFSILCEQNKVGIAIHKAEVPQNLVYFKTSQKIWTYVSNNFYRREKWIKLWRKMTAITNSFKEIYNEKNQTGLLSRYTINNTQRCQKLK